MKKALTIVAILTTSLIAMPTLTNSAFAATEQVVKLGDLSNFETIASDTLTLVSKGDMTAAEKRITDFETAWDNAEPTLYPKDKSGWSVIDDAADKAISSLRATKPDQGRAKMAVSGLVKALHP